ncbi:uncharacterized protein [Miscanthus floridulus]|uniref:uncharacterized protein n=1 Tax=Miscanthus floridulus TaxID=154761 RepID=UPI003457B877
MAQALVRWWELTEDEQGDGKTEEETARTTVAQVIKDGQEATTTPFPSPARCPNGHARDWKQTEGSFSLDPKAKGSILPNLKAPGSISLDPLGVGSILPDPKAMGSISPKATGSISPNPKAMVFVLPKATGSVSLDPLGAGSVLPGPKAAGSVSPMITGSVSPNPFGVHSVSPDPKAMVFVSSDGDPYHRQPL